MKIQEARDRIFVALDFGNSDKVASLVPYLVPYVGGFKIGLELISAVGGGPRAVKLVQSLRGRVFYDGKFHDIPNTMAGAAREVAGLGVLMFNVHASAGVEAMKAAVANRGDSLVLAVTVLTSLSDSDCQLIYGAPSRDRVMEFALMAKEAGCNGVICSPKELEFLRREPALANMLMVTPGVRSAWAAVGDQKRVMTPAEAIKAGASFLVIGRPITQPPVEIGSPVEAAQRIAEEIAEVL